MNTARMITRTVRGGAAMQPSGVTARSGMVPSGIRAVAAQTDASNLYKPIRVLPEEAQSLQWLIPGNTVEYTILTNFDWTIE